MDVTGRTICSLVWAWLQSPLLLGALLVVAVLAALTSPCEHGLCDRPGIQAPASASAHAAPLDAPLPASDVPIHCDVHCGFLLTPLLIALGAHALAACLPLPATVLRPRLLAPPLLPPPQAA